MTIGIVTDSTCDIPPDLVARHEIVVVPAYVNMDDGSYLDGVELSREEFYTRLPNCTPPPTTAAPSPGQFQQAYEQLAARGVTEILSIHLSSTLSNLYAAAQMAAQAMETVKVLTVDARQASMGLGFTVLAAARAAAAGQSLAGIVDRLKGLIQRTHLLAVIDTLEFLKRSGRLSFLEAGLGSLLQIKPIIKLHDGQIITERVRTRGQAMQRLLNLLHERLPVEQLAVMHVRARDRAEELLAEVRHLLPPPPGAVSSQSERREQGAGDIPIIEAAPAIAVHVGPGALGFVCVTAEAP